MELSNLVSDNHGKELSFYIKNIDLPYLNGLTRTIMSDISSYAFDHLEIINNTSIINNNNITNRLSMIPIDHPVAFIIDVKNDNPVSMHVTSSDITLYNLNDLEFQKYLNGLNKKKQLHKANQYREHDIEVDDTKEEVEIPINQKLKEYLEKNQNILKIELTNLIEKDLQIITLEPNGKFEAYGVSIPGKPSDHVKWQQGFAFKRQNKNIHKSTKFTTWVDIINTIIDSVTNIKSEAEFKNNKYIDLITYVLRESSDSFDESKKIEGEDPKYSEFKRLNWTKELKKKMIVKIQETIKKICDHVYNMDLKTYDEYQRCIPCIERISHLLKIEIKDIYEIEKLNEYIVTINSNTRLSKILWNQSTTVLSNMIEELNGNIESIINSNLVENKNQENGFTLKLNNIFHTLGNIIVFELRKDSKISHCSYTHSHPLNKYIEVCIKWKKSNTNPKQNAINTFKKILDQSVVYIKQIPLIY